MSIKLIGAIMIAAGGAGIGASMASAHRREEAALNQLAAAMSYMRSELEYHLLPLPELCRRTAGASSGVVATVFNALAEELESQLAPDAGCCMYAALAKVPGLPRRLRKHLSGLGISLGRFDLKGQLNGLDAVCDACRRDMEEMALNRDQRLRGYQTLGLCAGCGLAILFL